MSDHSEYPVMTVCGSMRYYKDMLKVAEYWTGEGWIVLMPFVADYVDNQPTDERKEMLDDMHKAKMAMSEMITVVGPHRGESTKREIAWAEEHGLIIREVNFSA